MLPWPARLLMRLVPEDRRPDLTGDLAEVHLRRKANGSASLAWVRTVGDAARVAWAFRSLGPPSMTTGMHDVRFALRQFLRHPGHTAIALVSLALGIGANTTVFSVVNTVFLNPLPIEDAGSVVTLYTHDANNPNTSYLPVGVPNYEDLVARATSFSDMAAVGGAGLTVIVGDRDPEQLTGLMVTGTYFDLLGVRPALGRAISPADDVKGSGSAVAVLSYAAWGRLFGEDPDAIGRTVRLNGQPFEVVGVAPPGFRGTSTLGSPELIFVPFETWPRLLPASFHIFYQARRAVAISPVARLRDGVSVEQAAAEMRLLAQQLQDDYPDDNRDRTLRTVPVTEAAVGMNQRGGMVQAAMVLLSVVGMVLLIACANLANLQLARSEERRRELSLRAALGGSRRRLVGQMMTESLILAVAGGLLGLLVARVGGQLLWSYRPAFLGSMSAAPALDGRVLAFTALVALGTAGLFGLLPALRASRPDLHETLKVGGRSGGAGRGGNRLRQGLVVAEIGLALVGLAGAGLFVRSLNEVRGVDPGFEMDGLAVVSVALGAEYGPELAEQYRREVLEGILAVPGVTSAAASATVPLGGPLPRTLIPEGATDDRHTMAGTVPVTPEYFESLGITRLRGRALSDLDRAESELVAVVNEAAADRFWPGEDPLGRRFSFYGDTASRTVVGVVENVALSQLGGPPETAVYLPLAQWHQPFTAFHVRTSGELGTVVPAVREAVQSVDRTLAILNVSTSQDLLGQSLWARRMGAALLSVFGAIALILAMLGIYGVMAYITSRRTQEMGLRMALGAGRGEVLRLVLGHGATLAGVGVGVGLSVSLAASRLLEGMLFGVAPTDALTFGTVSAVLFGVALLACLVPALRATRVSPMRAMGDG